MRLKKEKAYIVDKRNLFNESILYRLNIFFKKKGRNSNARIKKKKYKNGRKKKHSKERYNNKVNSKNVITNKKKKRQMYVSKYRKAQKRLFFLSRIKTIRINLSFFSNVLYYYYKNMLTISFCASSFFCSYIQNAVLYKILQLMYIYIHIRKKYISRYKYFFVKLKNIFKIFKHKIRKLFKYILKLKKKMLLKNVKTNLFSTNCKVILNKIFLKMN